MTVDGGWADRHPLLPVLLGLSLALVLFGILWWARLGPPTVLSGSITKIDEIPYHNHVWRYAVVQLPDGAVRADGDLPSRCAIGDRVRVLRAHRLLGPRYSLDTTSCRAPP